MKLPDEIKNQIIEALKPLDPERVILFGSYAYGNPNKDSDIDLYIVTKDDFMPKNYSEFCIIRSGFSERLITLRKLLDIDIIVHTKELNQQFFDSDNQLARQIKQGVALYER